MYTYSPSLACHLGPSARVSSFTKVRFSMTSKSELPGAFERLSKILALEKRQGYRNKAVIGGLDKFAARWEQDPPGSAGHPALDRRDRLAAHWLPHGLRARDTGAGAERHHAAPGGAPLPQSNAPQEPHPATGPRDQPCRTRSARVRDTPLPIRSLTETPRRPRRPRAANRGHARSKLHPHTRGSLKKNKPAPARQAPPPPERPGQPQQAAAKPPKGADKAAHT